MDRYHGVPAVGRMVIAVGRMVIDAVHLKGGTTEGAVDVLDSDEGKKLLENFATNLVRIDHKTRTIYPVRVNYNMSITEMLAAAEFTSVSDVLARILDDHNVLGKGEADIKVCTYKSKYGGQTTIEIIRDMRAEGLKPCDIETFLAFKSQYPEYGVTYELACLSYFFIGSGFVEHTPRIVARSLKEGGGKISPWFGNTRFAAVPL